MVRVAGCARRRARSDAHLICIRYEETAKAALAEQKAKEEAERKAAAEAAAKEAEREAKKQAYEEVSLFLFYATAEDALAENVTLRVPCS